LPRRERHPRIRLAGSHLGHPLASLDRLDIDPDRHVVPVFLPASQGAAVYLDQ
jgi:hypothetical protein